MKRDPAALLVGLFLLLLACILFVITYKLPATSELYQVCAFLLLLVTVTALSALISFIDGPPEKTVDSFTEISTAFVDNMVRIRAMKAANRLGSCNSGCAD